MTDEPTKRPMGRPTVYDPKYCEMIVEDMAKGYSMSAFAGLIGVCRETLTKWAEAHPEFLLAVKRGKSARLRDWETAAVNTRTNGSPPGSATITMFGLKNMDSGEWDAPEKADVKLKGKLEVDPGDGLLAIIGLMEGAARTKSSDAGEQGALDSDGEAEATSTSE